VSRQRKSANNRLAVLNTWLCAAVVLAQSQPMAMAQTSTIDDQLAPPVSYSVTPLPPPGAATQIAPAEPTQTSPVTPTEIPPDAPTRINRFGQPSPARITPTSGNPAVPQGRQHAPSAPSAADPIKANAGSTASIGGVAPANLNVKTPAGIDNTKSATAGTAKSAEKDAKKKAAAAATSKGNVKATADEPHLSPMTPKLAPLVPKMAPTGTTKGASGTAAVPSTGQGATGTAPLPGTTSGAPGAAAVNATGIPGDEGYPTVGKLETITFGGATPNVPIEKRLSKLEVAVLKKDFPDDSLFDRTERLKKILIGSTADETESPSLLPPVTDSLPMLQPEIAGTPGGMLAETFEDIANMPENQSQITKEQGSQFALELINDQRQKLAMSPLEMDSIAAKIANEQAADLSGRGFVSHSNSKGDNPDRRYTVAGGIGALTETLVTSNRTELGSGKYTKAAVARLLKTIASRQDDREALFTPEASDLGVSIDWTPERDKMIGCLEIVTKHGTIEPIPNQVRVGEKIDVRGEVAQPFKFERVTVAWEGDHGMSTTADESEEALPYFPPLDYAAYQQKSEHDYSTAITMLKAAGIVAAIAGGVFMPPVALAAPLIAMSGSMGGSEPKAVSDIPVHSGMHSDGSGFNGRIPINNNGKEGIYYVTVWASLGKGTKSFPISRRAIIAAGTAEDVQGKLEKHKSSAKAAKHKSNDNDEN